MIPAMTLPKLSWTIEDIPNPQTLRKRLWERVEEFTGNPLLVQFTAGLIKKWNVPERNDKALARAVQYYTQKHIKFFRESPERFASPMRTIAWGIGDCDDKSQVIAAILRSFRIPVRLKFIRFNTRDKNSGKIKPISHVYPQAKLDGEWVSLESVHPWAMGVDPEEKARAKGLKTEVHIIGDK